MRLVVVVGLATVVGCSDGKKSEPAPQPPGPHVAQLVHGDAGVTVADIDPTPMHMDEDVAAHPVAQQPPPARTGKPIDITLRSSPPGAQVAVDGRVLGTTPAYWSGTADGREHEFVFTMRGHAIARYRFVPITSGVIHGHLDPIHEETDAGSPAPPPEIVPPQQPTTSINPPSAPPTIVDDANMLPGPVPNPPAQGSNAAP